MILTGKTVKLKELLHSKTKEGELYERMPDDWVRCTACGHRCKIPPGKDGICKIRYNKDGRLFVPSGYVGGIAIDPIEKKPFFHAYPGSQAVSFGMLGCNFHCPFCQNWVTSQIIKNPEAIAHPEFISADEIVQIAIKYKTKIITSTYNEPLITSEWAVEVFKLAKKHNIVTSFVSNGNGSEEAVDFLALWLDLFKIDLKSFRQKNYAKLGGLLRNVLDTIKRAHTKGMWVEIVTLIVPGMNDSTEELTDIAKFIVSVSPDIPWHVTAFHSDYKVLDTPDTPISTLLKAVDIGYNSGLKFVYTGNRPGQTRNYENTNCPSCGLTLVERMGYHVYQNRIENGKCYNCKTPIPGRW